MKIGFTGSRSGMATRQIVAFNVLIRGLAVSEFHQGCAFGADSTATFAVRGIHRKAFIKGWQSNLESQTNAEAILLCDDLSDPKHPLIRNCDIVKATDQLIAAPHGPEELRSGTWATIRAARKLKKPITIVWPNGTVTKENHVEPGIASQASV